MDTAKTNGKNGDKSLPNNLSLEIEAERSAILLQLTRILESGVFKSSRNNREFLRYVVEHAHQGKKELLKERVLGVEVFGRDPGYDSNLDPVVRTTAGEVRKRLAQYYQEPAHTGEIRIDIPPGSYVPRFYNLLEEQGIKPTAQPKKKQQRYLWLLALLPIIAVLIYLLKSSAFQSAVDQFWNPVCNSSLPVILCIAPQPSQPPPTNGIPSSAPAESLSGSKSAITVKEFQLSDNVPLSDATTVTNLAVFLKLRGVRYEIRLPSELSLGNMRGRAVVFIGGFNNEWTRRMMQDMRYTFEADMTDNSAGIKDRQNPSQMNWKVYNNANLSNLFKDFGILARIWEPKIEQYMVFAGGIGRTATMSAGELATNPKYLKEILSTTPANWAKKNIQIVFETPTVQGSTGPPHVLATHVW